MNIQDGVYQNLVMMQSRKEVKKAAPDEESPSSDSEDEETSKT